MEITNIGPTILSIVAWGCSLNIIVASVVAEKEGWNVPEIVQTPRFRKAGKIGMFISMSLAIPSAGWWGLLIVPAGGMLFGGLSTAIFRETMMAISIPIGLLASIGCVIWLLFPL